MYRPDEASKIKQAFWTAFGKYMQPVHSASGLPVHWLNYKTGKKDLYFKMDATRQYAHIHIELHQKDSALRKVYYEQLLATCLLLESATGEPWEWIEETINESGKTIACVGLRLEEVNVLRQSDWPTLISFLKPRIIALDAWWQDAQYAFTDLP
jgi:hypothetical protein